MELLATLAKTPHTPFLLAPEVHGGDTGDNFFVKRAEGSFDRICLWVGFDLFVVDLIARPMNWQISRNCHPHIHNKLKMLLYLMKHKVYQKKSSKRFLYNNHNENCGRVINPLTQTLLEVVRI